MAIDYQRQYHTGIRVPNLDASMAELGPVLNVAWAEVRDMPEMQLWSPDRGVHSASLRFTYSCEGPQYVELLEASPGCIWDGRDDPGVHHVGVWVDDVKGEVDAALAGGWTCVAASATPEDGYGPWAYLQPPSGMIVEVVSEAIRAHFEPWWADGLAKQNRGGSGAPDQ